MTHSDLGPDREADNLDSRLDIRMVGTADFLTGFQYFQYLSGLLSDLVVALISFATLPSGRASK